MNLIPEIAEKLGVELGEEFEVLPKIAGPGYKSSRYRFSEQGLEFSNYIHCPSETGWSPTDTITGLLNGKISIIKLPFEPKYGDEYWTVFWSCGCRSRELEPVKFSWLFDYDDMLRKKLGIVYRTKAEVEKNMDSDYERITGHKWEEAFELGVMRYENQTDNSPK